MACQLQPLDDLKGGEHRQSVYLHTKPTVRKKESILLSFDKTRRGLKRPLNSHLNWLTNGLADDLTAVG